MVVEFARLAWGQPVRGLDWKNERCIELPLAQHIGRFWTPGRVLDAGCAVNQQIERPIADVTHVTFTLADERQHSDPRRTYVQADLRDLSQFPDRHFDRVLCISTLEHVGMDNSNYGGPIEQDLDACVTASRECWRVCGGRYVFTVPVGEHQPGNGHFQRFSPEGVQRLIPDAAHELRYYAKHADGWAGPFLEAQTGLVDAKVNQIAAVLAWR